MCQNVKTSTSFTSRGRSSKAAKSHTKTGLSGGKVRTGHSLHGTRNSVKTRARSRSRARKEKVQYDTPFDEKGRCHYHKNVQLASTRMSGGWKVILTKCPKCMEDVDDDDKSQKSSRSHRSSSDHQHQRVVEHKHQHDKLKQHDARGEAAGQFDKNGCCALHPHIQIAKKKVLGGWKVIRTCPTCAGIEVGLDDDDFSVCSGKSAKSTRSNRSTKSYYSHKGKRGEAVKSSKYGALPFDGEGYCCVHPSVRIAKRRAMGGWKVIHNVCPDCASEKEAQPSRRRRHSRSKPRSRSKSRDRRVIENDNASVAASFKSGKSPGSILTSSQKHRVRVKNLHLEDKSGQPGRYWGYVDKYYRPNGQGMMKYEDGTEWKGVWCEGSRVNGTT